MDDQISKAIGNSVPQIIVTEPSPISIPSQNTVSLVRKMESIPEVTKQSALPSVAQSAVIVSESVKMSSNQTAAESSVDTSEEFTPAQDCNDCVVPVPEQLESRSVESATTAASEPDQDDFRTEVTGCCPGNGVHCMEIYEKLWNIIHSGYAIPFWLMLLALPLSAGVMGALYMYSCPASHSIAILIFIIGISLMAVISLRICLIIHRMTVNNENEWRNMLHTLLLISTFLTVVFFITESVAYWRMAPTSHPGTPEYCDPHFLSYSFWWNCVMSVVIVPLFFFPA